MTRLLIANPRERRLVRLADVATFPLKWLPRRRAARNITRVLLLRLERIGDLLMTLEAIADARRAWPHAEIDLAVGSWNRELASLIPGVQRVHVADLPWLSRGEQPTSWSHLLDAARRWRAERYDIVVNFEPDIRTNFLAWLTRAPVRSGYDTSGGGAFLTDGGPYDPSAHVAVNARRLVARASGISEPKTTAAGPRLSVPPDRLQQAVERLGSAPRPWIGVHASGGRESKQWHLERFADVARRLAARTRGTIVLTGSPSDVDLVGRVADAIGDVRHVSLAGAASLPDLVATIAAFDVLVTGDTGPMHVAGAVETPVVALFGPSDPSRYGPRAGIERILRVQLHCSPCGQVRLPPERCRGHVPDCMDGITVETVVAGALDVLAGSRDRRRSPSA
jgi:lipopolysaccharide heptosyltransferase II